MNMVTMGFGPMIHFMVRWMVILVVSVSCGMFSSVPLVEGWGTIGHEIVANIAWSRLSPVTKDEITAILNLTSPYKNDTTLSPLGSVADWADRVRPFKPWSSPLHYIDVRDDLIDGGCRFVHGDVNHPQCHFDYSRDCEHNRCVAGAIVNYTNILMSSRTGHRGSKTTDSNHPTTHKNHGDAYSEHHLRAPPKADGGIQTIKQQTNSKTNVRREALMFVTHFVGDIHQPLHCSRFSDKGGNNFIVHFDLNPTSSPPVSYRHLVETEEHEEGANSAYRHLTERSDAKLQDTVRHLRQHNVEAAATTHARLDAHRRLTSSSHHHKKWNLHSVWDTGMIEVALLRNYNNSRQVMEEHLLKFMEEHPSTTIDRYLECSASSAFDLAHCTRVWGGESFALALEYAYRLSTSEEEDEEATSGSTITEGYYQSRMAIIEDQLMAAGVRLATVLEGIFSHDRDHRGHDENGHNKIVNKVEKLPSAESFWVALRMPMLR